MAINSIEELYAKSKELEGKYGKISIDFAGRLHVYEGNDVIGNCLQEWLPDWFKHLGVNVHSGKGTQEFPDFVVTFDNKEYDMEIKAWNIDSGAPGFDLANFTSFIDSTYHSPGKINAHYFVLGYSPENDDFVQGFIIKKVFMKYIWEMTAPAKKYPIGVQVKRNVVYALRPSNFYAHPEKCFKTKLEFLEAIRATYKMFPNSSLGFDADEWFEKVKNY